MSQAEESNWHKKPIELILQLEKIQQTEEFFPSSVRKYL